jgi:hypothetical protein
MSEQQLPCHGRWREFTSDAAIHPKTAERMCRGCPILEQCLLKALRHEMRNSATARAAIWGGTTPKQRWQIATRGTGHQHAHRLRHQAFGVEPEDCHVCTPSRQRPAA